MPFKVTDAVILPPKVKREPGPKKEKPRLFDEYKATQINNIIKSMEDYEGKYVHNRVLHDGEGKIITRAAPNWRVEIANEGADQIEDPDTLAIFFKVGPKKWNVFEGGKNEEYVYSVQIPDKLKEMRKFIEDMKEDSEDGQSFLEMAKKAASVKGKYGWNPDTGRMDKGHPDLKKKKKESSE